ILLLNKAVVIFLVGTAPAQFEAGDGFPPETHEMVIEEFGAIIGMQFFHRKRQALQDAAEPALHRLLAFAQDGYPLTPASCHIYHLQRKGVDAIAAFPTVLDQVNFKMAW